MYILVLRARFEMYMIKIKFQKIEEHIHLYTDQHNSLIGQWLMYNCVTETDINVEKQYSNIKKLQIKLGRCN